MNSWQLIEKYQELKGMNQNSMAIFLGKHKTFMTEIKKGRSKLPLETKLMLAKELGYSDDQIFLWDKEERAKTDEEKRIIQGLLSRLSAFFGIGIASGISYAVGITGVSMTNCAQCKTYVKC